jgi:phosphoribosylaminoimidazole-succinocarboxamide synthase
MNTPNLPMEALMTVTGLPYRLHAKGKVREVFDCGEHYLIIATDRLSAFDVVMPNGVPGKGILLTQLSLWWFAQAKEIFPTHLVDQHSEQLAKVLKGHEQLISRSMLVKKLTPLPVEAVVRGYLAGGGYKEYNKSGAILDHALPAGLLDGSQLPSPIFTPTTKAAQGHDEAITLAECSKLLGEETFKKVQDTSIALYKMGATRAAKAGVILADTKFEFGKDAQGNLVLIDEVLTPDSSRYWPAASWKPGQAQPSYDKQFVRDWLESQPWNKTSPGPTLPEDVIRKTQSLYSECLQRLTA